jgi:hypothetical protein
LNRIKYNKFVTEKDVNEIVESKFQGLICPSCGKVGIYAGCIETQYDEKRSDTVVLSFDVFCKICGDFIGKWDNTNREYFLSKR